MRGGGESNVSRANLIARDPKSARQLRCSLERRFLARPGTELDDGNWKNHDYDPEYHLANPESRRALRLVEVKRSWCAFSNHAPMEQVLEGGGVQWQVFARPRSGRRDCTECSERGT
jgi:hypothetical protein